LGVRINGGSWFSAACLLGDITQVGAFATSWNCGDPVMGSSTPNLAFIAGEPLFLTFKVSHPHDTVQFGAALDNIGQVSITEAATQITAALGDGIQGFGGALQLLGAALAEVPGGAAVSAFGTLVAVIGSAISVKSDLNPDTSVIAREDCLGGLLG